ncbi:MAG TPA: 3-oxoacyl-[acyl-carrier-protein] synthase III C-terminal domain-containing protein [Stackebrandtia sp.]|jgi:predicted naringenin-chalcone synthase|uniref:type III polyketide synthase n=1 Tax=Stackebrandtia sp. TaxID=2023065 RepID=UPI002D581C3F|nr:3-oxoacyl-[acyl-carrier-protein] synthase III C-terminal domain-containing protein [Stackebrandtia sp.]HZE41188.1 3-oxoacyl-[acyl-carrier-protein] synthase III C-terminal domain-containing protein [Stackebrandtia sp.]
MVKPIIAGFGEATPGVLDQETLWDGYFEGHTSGDDRAKKIFLNAGVDTRHGVIDPLTEDISQWTTAQRMARYETESVPLGERALRDALRDANVDAAELGLLTTVSCTGYVTPGLDITLAARLGAAADMRRVVVGHMGCYAAIPALSTVADYVRQSGRPAALLCVELTSLHLQPAPLNTEQTVAHALFSDAAAAVVLVPGGEGLEVVDIASRTDTAHSAAMTWRVTDQGFRMGLSSRVPLVLARHLPDTVTTLLRRHDATIDDIDAWAIHPGGRRILDVAADVLRLDETRLRESREVLRQHGNCSSATVLMILNRLRRTRPAEAVACAFGPGLTLYAALLRRSRP